MIRPTAYFGAAVGACMVVSLLWGQVGESRPSDVTIRADLLSDLEMGDGQHSEKSPVAALPVDIQVSGFEVRPAIHFVGLSTGVDKYAPVNPVKANGPIFVDWPKPDVLLVFSGDQDGYLEPCGCAGLQNQKGGLKRRHTLLKELEARGWPIIAMDLGGQVRRFGKQAEMKFERTYQSLEKMGYAAVGFGTHDLRMDMLPVAINLDPEKSMLVSANVGILDFESGFSRRYKVIEVNAMRIGVTSVLGKTGITQLQNLEDVVIEPPGQAISKILPDLMNEQCEQMVLLVYASRQEAEDLARRFPAFDWVVAAKGADEPPNSPTPIKNQLGKTIARLVEVGHKGMYVVAVGLYKNATPDFRYQRVPIDHRFKDSPEMGEIFAGYQDELETLGLAGLGLNAIEHPSGRRFAGSEVCGDCHGTASQIHENTPHAHATQTLVDLDPAREYDPECLSCHVTGWHPQNYFPFVSGYSSLEKTPHMSSNGCENCHGPAKRHAEAEYGNIDMEDKELEALREELRLQIVDNEGNMEGQVFKPGSVVEMCMECHDLDNSPDFDFQVYWPKVEHQGKD
jgi:hypothetical protein